MNDHETQILNFLLKYRRERARYLLQKKRGGFIKLLDHPRIFDPRFLHKVDPHLQKPEYIAERLRKKVGEIDCYLISSDPDLDQKTMPITTALEHIIGYGFGTFVSVLPGKLGYLETADMGERFTVY